MQGASGDQFDQLYKYYRDVYAKARDGLRASSPPGGLTQAWAQVTVDDIAGYERTYRGSAEEERDLKELFTRFGGDMNQCVHDGVLVQTSAVR